MGKDDWKKFEENNPEIFLIVLYTKNEKLYPAYTSKYNSEHDRQIILLVIPNKEGCHYLALSIGWITFGRLEQKTNLNRIKKNVNKIFCIDRMLYEKNTILEFTQYLNANETPSLIFADLESLIKKTRECKNNPEKSATIKADEHILCNCLMSIMWTFDDVKSNKHDVYRGEAAWKSFRNH